MIDEFRTAHTIVCMIHTQGLTKNYGLNPVLRGVDLEVAAGDFVVLIGPNGAGKTTLMRILSTLLRPSAGEVMIGGWPLRTHADKVRRHIGLVSHQPMVYGDLTAAENLAFFARLYQLDHQEERITQALKAVGLLARQRDAVNTFSRGMLQRLTLARATLHEPDVLLLDEPYTGLDQTASHLLDDLLQQEMSNGRTILMITHDLRHGLNLCQRIAILNKGRIVSEINSHDIDPAELLTIYAQATGSL